MADTTGPLRTVALDAHDLRGRLRRRTVWTFSACIACSIVAIASAVVLSAVDAHLSDQQSKLDRYQGEILAVHGDGGDSDDGWVRVEFTQHGRHRTADVDIANTASFSSGEATVLVDPHDRNFVTLPGENYFDDGPGLAILLVGGFGIAAIGFGAVAAKTRRNFDVLASSTWTTVSGFVVKVVQRGGEGSSSRWVLFLPDHEGGSFWVFQRALPMPRFTGSVAMDGRGRLVHRIADGARLAYATRARSGAAWVRHRIADVTQLGDQFTFRYGILDEEHRCTIQLAGVDAETASAVTSAIVVDLLAGPLAAAAVHVPGLGIVGAGKVGKQRTKVRRQWLRARGHAVEV